MGNNYLSLNGTLSGSLNLSGSLDIIGPVTASHFVGDGSLLTNIPGISGSTVISDTYEDIYNAYTGSTLIPGAYYLINDFQTCYDQPNFDHNGSAITTGNYKTGATEQLIVLATSNNSFSSQAYSLEYPKDKITYDITWNITEVTNSPAKGRITERIDDKNNRADYDFRAVQFKRYVGYFSEVFREGKLGIDNSGVVYGTGTTFNTNFSVGGIIGIFYPNAPISCFTYYEVTQIDSDTSMVVSGKTIWPISNTYYSQGYRLPDYMSPFQCNISGGTNDESAEYYTFNNDANYNTYLGDNKNYNTFILSNNVFLSGDYNNNTFGGNVVGNTFNDDMDSNIIGPYCEYNIITNDFDRNDIGSYFQKNIIDCDMESNLIGNFFEHNMLGDDDGNDFDFNRISKSFRNNFLTFSNNDFLNNNIGNNVYENIIDSGFENNTIVGDFYQNVIRNNNFNNNVISSLFYNNNIPVNFNSNTVGTQFYNNNIWSNFNENTFGENVNGNTFGDSNNIQNYQFTGNKVGGDFVNNTFSGETLFNTIGHGCANNNIGTNFSYNQIGSNFTSNNITNGFQQNSVLASNVSGVDFTINYGNILSIAAIANPNVGGTDGVYQLIPTTTNGQGVNATFDVTITSGIASVAIVNVGKLYQGGDSLFITGSLIGGGSDLTLEVSSVSPTPVVYTTIDSTIVRNFNNELKLTYIGTSFGIVGITEPVD